MSKPDPTIAGLTLRNWSADNPDDVQTKIFMVMEKRSQSECHRNFALTSENWQRQPVKKQLVCWSVQFSHECSRSTTIIINCGFCVGTVV
jgi:hypothetical protein